MPLLVAALAVVARGRGARRPAPARPARASAGNDPPYSLRPPYAQPGAGAGEEWTVPTSREEAAKQAADYGAKLTTQAVTAFTSDAPPISEWLKSLR